MEATAVDDMIAMSRDMISKSAQVRHNKRACASVITRVRVLIKPLEALAPLLQGQPDAFSTFRAVIDRLYIAVKKAQRRVEKGIDQPLGVLRRRLNPAKEKEKFESVVEELLEGALDLNVLLNTFLVRGLRSQKVTGPRTATALYAYKPTIDGDLPFEVGDVIEIVDTDGRCWWTGETAGKKGKFPLNYVLVNHDVSRGVTVGRATLGEWEELHGGAAPPPKASESAPPAAPAGLARDLPTPPTQPIRLSVFEPDAEVPGANYRPPGPSPLAQGSSTSSSAAAGSSNIFVNDSTGGASGINDDSFAAEVSGIVIHDQEKGSAPPAGSVGNAEFIAQDSTGILQQQSAPPPPPPQAPAQQTLPVHPVPPPAQQQTQQQQSALFPPPPTEPATSLSHSVSAEFDPLAGLSAPPSAPPPPKAPTLLPPPP